MLAVITGVNISNAATFEVGPGKTYATIQAAVNASTSAGDVVDVYPGTYAECVVLPNSWGGTSNNPSILKAHYAARKPLDEALYASNSANRAVIDATGCTGSAAIGNYDASSSAPVEYFIVDGFWINAQGASGGIWFRYDNHYWIKNNVCNNVVGVGENSGCYRDDHHSGTADHLWQNNWSNMTAGVGTDATGSFIVDSPSTWEYNQCTLNSGSANKGRCFYVASGSTGSIGKYNYLELRNIGETQYSRWRDTTGFVWTNNFIYSSVANQVGFVFHENTNAGKTEAHTISNNTWLGVSWAGADGALWLGFQNNDTINYNIFEATTNDTNSAAISEGWSGQGPGSGNTGTGNVYYQLAALMDADLTGYSMSATTNAAPAVSSTTGCSGNLNNATYGANLNVSSVPYCKCDGTAHPATGMFGKTVTVTACPAGNITGDTTPPIPPVNLRVM